jgi:hypothetical protein
MYHHHLHPIRPPRNLLYTRSARANLVPDTPLIGALGNILSQAR